MSQKIAWCEEKPPHIRWPEVRCFVWVAKETHREETHRRRKTESFPLHHPHYMTGYREFMFSQLECGELYKSGGYNLSLLQHMNRGYLWKCVMFLSSVYSILGNTKNKNKRDENHSSRQRRNVCLKGWVVLNFPFGSQQRWSTYVSSMFSWTSTSMFIQVKWKWPLRNHPGHILTSVSTILKLFQQFNSQFHFLTTSKERDCLKSNSSLFHL